MRSYSASSPASEQRSLDEPRIQSHYPTPPELLGYPVNPDPVTDIDFEASTSVRKLHAEDSSSAYRHPLHNYHASPASLSFAPWETAVHLPELWRALQSTSL
ncbi:hypothetical protein BHE90_016414 [Fusarium euwallaceae]|uniref:Uncharacterized protein n=1 Tax=Fusarium euwallaceae TaxID=1147111 RepID=A0A430L0J3_9HYPO|nr:hypothetical protein BHE90_016414 [Fusarium euwallaceae]